LRPILALNMTFSRSSFASSPWERNIHEAETGVTFTFKYLITNVLYLFQGWNNISGGGGWWLCEKQQWKAGQKSKKSFKIDKGYILTYTYTQTRRQHGDRTSKVCYQDIGICLLGIGNLISQ
jgi:hypothetical protein